MAAILVLNGPNLNLLGVREPGHYGHVTLAGIEGRLCRLANDLDLTLSFRQSNAEHELIEAIHQAPAQGVAFILFNPVAIPFIEVHLSNVHARESFRRHSYFSDLAVGVISGLGATGYELALRAAAERLARDTTPD